MQLGEIYKLAVKLGAEKDPRGKKGIEQVLKDSKEEFEGLKKSEKEYFDKFDASKQSYDQHQCS